MKTRIDDTISQAYDAAPRYQSYLLRCWEVRGQHPEHPTTWRFSLHDPQTGEQYSFADIEALATFLETTLGMPDARAQDKVHDR